MSYLITIEGDCKCTNFRQDFFHFSMHTIPQTFKDISYLVPGKVYISWRVHRFAPRVYTHCGCEKHTGRRRKGEQRLSATIAPRLGACLAAPERRFAAERARLSLYASGCADAAEGDLSD